MELVQKVSVTSRVSILVGQVLHSWPDYREMEEAMYLVREFFQSNYGEWKTRRMGVERINGAKGIQGLLLRIEHGEAD